MPTVTVRPFRRSDRDQLTDLVNAHAQAVLPGVSISVNAVVSQLEREPGEFIVDPWVDDRATLVAEQRGRISAAAHLVRYGGGPDVGPAVRGAGEIRWLLQWPDAPFWPDATTAGREVGHAAVRLLRAWDVRECLADSGLPAPGLGGVPEQWPHVRRLLAELGFTPGREESLYLADVAALPARGRPGLTVTRTLGTCGTRFTAAEGDADLGYIEVDTSIAGAARLSSESGWADIGNLHVVAEHRRRGVATALLARAAEWLRLGRIDRLIAYAAPDDVPLTALLERSGFIRLTTSSRAWRLADRPVRTS